jgi:hypothetical protein
MKLWLIFSMTSLNVPANVVWQMEPSFGKLEAPFALIRVWKTAETSVNDVWWTYALHRRLARAISCSRRCYNLVN